MEKEIIVPTPASLDGSSLLFGMLLVETLPLRVESIVAFVSMIGEVSKSPNVVDRVVVRFTEEKPR